jgi:PAS domain S-box-containing protein
MKKMAITRRLLTSILSVAGIAFILMISIMIYSIRNSISSFAKFTAKEMTYRYVNYIDSELEIVLSKAQTFKQILQTMFSENEINMGLAHKLLKEDLKSNTHIESVWLYFDESDKRKVLDQHELQNVLLIKAGEEIITHRSVNRTDINIYEIYSKMRSQGKEMLIKPYFSESLGKKKVMNSIVVPISVNKDIIGMVGFDIDLSYIKKNLNSFRPWEEGYFILVDNHGVRISHIRDDLIGIPVGDDTPKVKQDLLDAIKKGKEFTFSKRALGTGKLSWMTYVPIHVGDSVQPWSLCLVIPMNKVMQNANFLSLILIVISIVFLVIFVLLIFRNMQKLKHDISCISSETDHIVQGVENNDMSVRGIEDKVVYEFKPIIRGFNEILDLIQDKDSEKMMISEKLEETKILLNSIIESMPSLLITLNSDLSIIQLNKSARLYSGLESDKIIHRDLFEVFPEIAIYRKEVEQVMNKKEEFLLSYQKFNHRNEYFNLFFYPLENKEFEGIVLRIDDVTELQKKEAELRQSQKMELIGNLAGGLAHDFNNVLGIIIGNLSLLKLNLDTQNEIDREEVEDSVLRIQQASRRAADLVSQLLSLARKKELDMSLFNVNDLVKKVIHLSKNTIDKSISIDVAYLSQELLLIGDEGQIEQVLLNLIVNASHAMTIMREHAYQNGGFIKINVQEIHSDYAFCKTHIEAEEVNYVCISVEDNGVGMSTSVISKIFEPFYTTKDKDVGTGLGLSMVYNIIKQHRGFVDVYSEKGIGSKFSIYLPIIQTGIVNKEEKILQIEKGEGTVLVIDDDLDLRTVCLKMLKAMNYKSYSASDGISGVELYQHYHTEIDLILLDVVMPKKSGDECVRDLLMINPDAKILVSSGFKKDHRVEQLIKQGALDFIQKPYTIEELSAILKRCLKK